MYSDLQVKAAVRSTLKHEVSLSYRFELDVATGRLFGLSTKQNCKTTVPVCQQNNAGIHLIIRPSVSLNKVYSTELKLSQLFSFDLYSSATSNEIDSGVAHQINTRN